MNWQEIIPGKVAIRFNKRQPLFHYFSLGEITGGTLFPFTEKTKWKIDIHIVENPGQHRHGPFQQFSTFYEVGSDWILYRRTYGGLHCEMLVEGILSHNVTVYVNPFYFKRLRVKLDNLYPVGIHLTDILLYDILTSGDLVVHGASLHNPETGAAFLVIAPPDTGKTYTTYKLLQKGFKFLGEDLSYYDAAAHALRCMPYTSTWGHRFNVKKIDVGKVPFVSLLTGGSKKGVEDLFGRDSIQTTSPLKRIYLIEKADRSAITKIKASGELLRKTMAIQRNEFSYFKNPLLRAFEYCNSSMEIDKAFAAEQASMEKLFQSTELYLIQAPKSEDFEGLILQAEGQ
jgi:hypothetical protein